MNKGLKWILISLPILVGGYIVYRELTKESRKKKNDEEKKGEDKNKVEPIPSYPTKTTNPKPTFSIKNYFPLMKGVKNEKVKELQWHLIQTGLLPKYGIDGDFGSETQNALKKTTGKSSLKNQAEFDDAVKKIGKAIEEKQKTSNPPLVYKYESPMKQLTPFLTIK